VAIKFRDYYDILKIPRTASDEEIKKAYHRLAREHHPDLHSEKDKHVRTQRMHEVNEAYAVLSSKEDRAKYDQFGENWKGGAPSPAEPQEEAFIDFSRHMFRQGEGRGPGLNFLLES